MVRKKNIYYYIYTLNSHQFLLTRPICIFFKKRYKQTTKLCNNMFGIEDIVFDYENQIQVIYITQDQLIIQLEPLTQRVSKVLVIHTHKYIYIIIILILFCFLSFFFQLSKEKIKIDDLNIMVKGKHIKDVASTIIFEALARLEAS